MNARTELGNETPIQNGLIIHSLMQSIAHGLTNVRNILPLLKRVMDERRAYAFQVKCTKESVSYGTIREFVETQIPRGLRTSKDDVDIFSVIDAAVILNPGLMTPDEIEELKDWIRND